MDLLTEQAQRLAQLLIQSGLSVVTAESCTGGQLSEIMTRIPGSSTWFDCGFVTYSNKAKQELLHVPESIIKEYGAVSEETAIAMAEGALGNSHADVSVAITGIAGPDGGSEDKPVGTVCLAWSMKNAGTQATRIHFEGDRLKVRDQSCMLALQGLIEILQRDTE